MTTKILFALAFIITLTACTADEKVSVSKKVPMPTEIKAKDSTTSNLNTVGTPSEDILYKEDGSVDTSNWKTYRNEEFGFEMKYPNTMSYDEIWGPGIFDVPCKNKYDHDGGCDGSYTVIFSEGDENFSFNVLTEGTNYALQDTELAKSNGVTNSGYPYFRNYDVNTSVGGCDSNIYFSDLELDGYSFYNFTPYNADKIGNCEWISLDATLNSVVNSFVRI